MLPGQEYNADRQCKVAFGFNSTFCGGERVRKRLFWQERMNLNILRERVWTTRYKSDTSSCRLCSSVGDRSRSYMVTEISISENFLEEYLPRATIEILPPLPCDNFYLPDSGRDHQCLSQAGAGEEPGYEVASTRVLATCSRSLSVHFTVSREMYHRLWSVFTHT